MKVSYQNDWTWNKQIHLFPTLILCFEEGLALDVAWLHWRFIIEGN